MAVNTRRMVRQTSPYGYRSGEWAEIVSRVIVNGRETWTVLFSDGAADSWVVDDPQAGYEFATEYRCASCGGGRMEQDAQLRNTGPRENGR